MASTEKETPGEMCIYFVSCILLLAILTGGALLSLYIALPASDTAAWYPIAGMALVAMPWLFWGVTSLYRIVSLRRAAASAAGPGRPPPVKPQGAVKEEAASAAAESPGGARRVRFGATVVLGDGQPAQEEKSPGASVGPPAQDGSSHTSHESERPLFVED